MPTNRKNRRWIPRHPRGSVLIVTLWIVLLLASLVIVFSQTIRVEALATANHISAVKAEKVASGSIQYVMARLAAEEDSEISYDSNPYEAVPVGDGYFWVIRPSFSDDRNYDYGPSDLAGKINLNSASLEILLKLPAMPSELAPSIIDWRDSDDEITSGGAENEYYLLLSDPYYCKNSALETVGEIQLIQGGDRESLYGEDQNRNGVLDWNENDAEKSTPSDNSNGKLDYGYSNYVTVTSYERNQDQTGEKRINVNDMKNQAQLGDLVRQICGEGNYFQIMDHIRMRSSYESLINFYYTSGTSYEEFNQMIDKLTTTEEEKLVGLVNVNTAPSEVLLCLPGLEQSDVDSLITKRNDTDTDLTTILWITQILSKEKALKIGNCITIHSFQYSADIIAVSGDGRAFKRYYVIIDLAGSVPRIVYQQPLQSLGWPLESKIRENLRKNHDLG